MTRQRRERDDVDDIVEQWHSERPELDASSLDVFGRLARVHALRHNGLARFLSAHGLTPPAFDVLANLRRSGPPHRKTPSELASSSLLTSAGITFRLDRLERDGLIRRVPEKDDRRVMYAELTPEGLALIDRVMSDHFTRDGELLAEFTAAERRSVTDLLAKLERVLRDDQGQASEKS